jgi:hypothetical protein
MRTRTSIAGGTTALDTARLVTAACALVSGCGTDDLQAPESAQQRFTSQAWPALATCAGCHATRPAIDFLAPGTVAGAYATVFAFQPPLVDLASPESSLLLTMGKHTGPALSPAESAAVLAWLEAERTERMPASAQAITFGPLSVSLGAVTVVDLGHGAVLRFVPSAAADGLAVRRVELAAGTTGLHVVHPLFATHPPLVPPRIDASDAFGDVDLVLAAGQGVSLGGGSAAFPDFDPADPITIHFRTLEAP